MMEKARRLLSDMMAEVQTSELETLQGSTIQHHLTMVRAPDHGQMMLNMVWSPELHQPSTSVAVEAAG